MSDDPAPWRRFYDLDPEALAADLRDLADGIETNDVAIQRVETGDRAGNEETTAVQTLEIEFVRRRGTVDLSLDYEVTDDE